MHEFTLASSIRDIVLETANAHAARRIVAVHCRVGAMRQVCADLLRTAFTACCEKTPAAGASLVIEDDLVHVICRTCGHSALSDHMIWQCPSCGDFDLAFEGGTELSVMSLDIEQENDDGDQGASQRSGAQRRNRGRCASAAR
jgi:hydrogenase nickel incorporation protein HypA/HybF